jgi:hypothetical protein
MRGLSQERDAHCKFPSAGAAMTTDPGKEIRSLFARAALQHEAARGLDGEGWAAYRKIHADHAEEVRLQECRFLAEYQTRFEVARQRIIDQSGSWDKKLAPRWFGSDKFNSSAIDRQADRDVQHDHANLLTLLDQERDGRLDALFAAVEARPELGSQLKQHFERAADRRSGPDRRGPER